jgi:hypothetical protein
VPDGSQEITRQQLVEARDTLREQIYVLEHPMRGYDLNPQLIAKLKTMLADAEKALEGFG